MLRERFEQQFQFFLKVVNGKEHRPALHLLAQVFHMFLGILHASDNVKHWHGPQIIVVWVRWKSFAAPRASVEAWR